MTLILTEQQLKYRYSILCKTEYEHAVYNLYKYLINEDGTEFIFPKPDYQKGDYAKLYKNCGFKTKLDYEYGSRKIRYTTVKLMKILVRILNENDKHDKVKLLLESKIISNMIDVTEQERPLNKTCIIC